MVEDNYRLNWCKKNISTDILKVFVDECNTSLVNKTELGLSTGSKVWLVYPTHTIEIWLSEWGGVEKLPKMEVVK